MAITADVVDILSLHIKLFYIISAKLYNWQLNMIISLFHLFRGKKRNVLRNRLDSCDYDVDQLLLGTILFTVLVFLFPTVAVYYLLFTFVRSNLRRQHFNMSCFLGPLGNTHYACSA